MLIMRENEFSSIRLYYFCLFVVIFAGITIYSGNEKDTGNKWSEPQSAGAA